MLIIKSKQPGKELEEYLLALLKKAKIDAELFSLSSQYQFTFQGLTIDGSLQQVLQNGRPVPLTNNEFNLLLFLASHPEQFFSKEELFRAVWGKDSENTQKVVANTISNLRKKIDPCSQNMEYIRTVRGGYVFCGKVP